MVSLTDGSLRTTAHRRCQHEATGADQFGSLGAVGRLIIATNVAGVIGLLVVLQHIGAGYRAAAGVTPLLRRPVQNGTMDFNQQYAGGSKRSQDGYPTIILGCFKS